MFKDKYKREMDNIKPSEESIKKILNPSPKRNNRSIIRIAIACILSIALIFSFAIGAFINSKKETSYDRKYDKNDESDVSSEETIKLTGIRKAKSHSEINTILKDAFNNPPGYGFNDPLTGVDQFGNAVAPDRAPELEDGVVEENTGSDSDHSDTNNQVSGVQESEIIKNDGEYIYYYSTDIQKLYIIKANNGNPIEISKINLPNTSVMGMMLFENTICIINYKYPKTHCDYYDITDKSAPKLKYSTTQDGHYIDSRAIGNMLYVITNYYIYRYDDIIPECNDDRIEAECIYIPDHINSSAFTVITAFDVSSDKNEFKSSLSILGGASTIYSGKENLYFFKHSFDNKTVSGLISNLNTSIYRIALNNGNLILDGSGCVPGTAKDQFNIDESGDILRIATNMQLYERNEQNEIISYLSEKTVNRVFCLDKDLKIIGQSEDIGITEQIKSVRYIGDIAYVVTFRQTDPLYAIDLSNPESPKTLSELKIDGFSTYMHPFGSNYMIGIGYDADPENGRTTGLKITVFDISNPNNIFDISSYVLNWDHNIGESYYDSESTYNHKALLIDYKKNIIAIPLTETIHGEIWETSRIKTAFVFFTFDGNKIIESSKVVISDFLLSEYSYNQNIRGLYIGNYGYVIDNNRLLSISLDNMEKLETITLE